MSGPESDESIVKSDSRVQTRLKMERVKDEIVENPDNELVLLIGNVLFVEKRG